MLSRRRFRSRTLRRITADDDPRLIRQFKPPIRRWRWRSWLDARKAAKAGVSAADYLISRLRSYLRRAPQDGYPLPVIVSVNGPKIEVVPNPRAHDHALLRFINDPAGVSAGPEDPQGAMVRWLRATRAAEAQQLARELTEAEEENGRLRASFVDVNERLTELSRQKQAEIAEGDSLPPATLVRREDLRGRPALGFPWALLACGLVTAIALAAEAYQFALPWFNLNGIDAANLPAEWRRDPSGILLGAAFALMASGGLFVLTHWLFELGRSLYQRKHCLGQALAKSAGTLTLAVLLGATAYYVGALRHGAAGASQSFLAAMGEQSARDDSGTTVFFLVTILVPLAVAWIWHKAAAIADRRNEVRARQREWDAEENRRIEVAERREEILRQMREERESLQHQMDGASDRIRNLERRTQEAELQLRQTVDTWRRYAAAFAGSLVAAMEQDRYYFVREARRRGRHELLGERPPASHNNVVNAVPAVWVRGRNGHGQTQDPLLSSTREHPWEGGLSDEA